MCEEEAYRAVEATVAAIAPVTDWTVAITIMLTALAVILAALAITVGIAAVWGYVSIKEDAGKIATKAAEKKLAEYFEQQGFKDKIREAMPQQPVEEGTAEQAKPYTGEEDGHASDDVKKPD
jgi:hypothetical protein